jgi:hypothetical protein
MIEGTLEVPPVENAAVLGYAPSSAERAALEATLRDLTARRAPHRHAQTLGVWHAGGVDHVHAAIDAAAKAKPAWEAMPFKERAAIFLRAAELLATRWRPVLNAATMLGQSQDRAPGRDRRGLRAHRLLALQRRLRVAPLRRAAPSARRACGTSRPPPARGLRARGVAVQLHLHRGQPPDGARPAWATPWCGSPRVERRPTRPLHDGAVARRPGCPTA